MTQQESDVLLAQNGGNWGTIEYTELECEKCKKIKGIVFFGDQTDSTRKICASCWWKHSPQELKIGPKEPEISTNQRVVAGVTPATVVRVGEVTLDTLEAALRKTRDEHGPLLADYHKVWYEASYTWPYTHFLGVGMMKCPNDLWVYQALLTTLRPTTIIETGTYQGGSALWFAYLMDMLGIDGGRVFTVDFEDHRTNERVLHPRITFLGGNSVDPKLVDAIKAEIVPGPMLICLDSDHSAKHVREELELYAPLCKVGDWLVVEDTNIGWTDGKDHTITFNGDLGRCACGMQFMLFEPLRNGDKPKCPKDKNDLGARGGLIEYMDKHGGEWRQDILSERYLLTMNPGGWLQRVAECSHE